MPEEIREETDEALKKVEEEELFFDQNPLLQKEMLKFLSPKNSRAGRSPQRSGKQPSQKRFNFEEPTSAGNSPAKAQIMLNKEFKSSLLEVQK